MGRTARRNSEQDLFFNKHASRKKSNLCAKCKKEESKFSFYSFLYILYYSIVYVCKVKFCKIWSNVVLKKKTLFRQFQQKLFLQLTFTNILLNILRFRRSLDTMRHLSLMVPYSMRNDST